MTRRQAPFYRRRFCTTTQAMLSSAEAGGVLCFVPLSRYASVKVIKRAKATPLMTTVGVFAARAASATAAEAVPVAFSPPLALSATVRGKGGLCLHPVHP
jgi:hypothetical protein